VVKMPGQDQTGPFNQGPKTGRGFGPCGMGLGWRNKFGKRGLGRYFCWNWPKNKQEEKESLEEYKEALKEELDDVDKELKDTDK